MVVARVGPRIKIRRKPVVVLTHVHRECQAHLMQMIFARRGSSGVFGPGKSWKQHRGQDCDNRNHYKQFNQGEAVRRERDLVFSRMLSVHNAKHHMASFRHGPDRTLPSSCNLSIPYWHIFVFGWHAAQSCGHTFGTHSRTQFLNISNHCSLKHVHREWPQLTPMLRNSISEEMLGPVRQLNPQTGQGGSLHWSRGVLFAMLLALSGSSHTVEIGASAADRLQQTGLDAFKQFMASPPVIEGLLYEKIMARDTQKGLADGVPGTNGRVTYGFAKCQPGCLYLKLGGSDLVAAPNLQSGEEIDAMLGVEHWRIDPIGLCAYWKDSAKQPEQIRMGPSRLFHQRSDDFKQVLNMGVMHLEPGAIKWAGDTFNVSGYVPEAKAWVEVEGTIRPGPDGRAQEMTRSEER